MRVTLTQQYVRAAAAKFIAARSALCLRAALTLDDLIQEALLHVLKYDADQLAEPTETLVRAMTKAACCNAVRRYTPKVQTVPLEIGCDTLRSIETWRAWLHRLNIHMVLEQAAKTPNDVGLLARFVLYAAGDRVWYNRGTIKARSGLTTARFNRAVYRLQSQLRMKKRNRDRQEGR